MARPAPGIREPLLAFAAATLATAALALVGRVAPFVRDNLHAFIAVVFFYTPALAARASGRRFEYEEAGLRLRPIGLNLAVLGLIVALTLPAFVAGFFLFYDSVCAPGGSFLRPAFESLCPRWRGWAGATLVLPPAFLLNVANQLIVVALPEEVFFRGYLLGRLEERWPSRRRIAGAPVGWALLVSSALFALGHLVVIPHPQRLAVFFPALVFGWMRARTGSVAAAATYHALCNVLADVLHRSSF